MTPTRIGSVWLVWAFLATPAAGQWTGDTVPVSMLPQQTIGFEAAAPPYPDVVLTAGEIATSAPSGAYHFRCPSGWLEGGVERLAAVASGEEIYAVSAGQLWRSVDGGCEFQPVPLPDGGVAAIDVVSLFGRVYVLVAGFVSGVVYSVTATSDGEEVHRWGQGLRFLADTGFAPSGMIAWQGTGLVGGVVVVGHEPTPQVWGALAGGDGSSLVGWRELGPLLPLNGVLGMDARGVSPSGELWVLVRHATGDRLIFGVPEEPGGFATGAPFIWTADDAFHDQVHGPAWMGDGWLAWADGRWRWSAPLDASAGAGGWSVGAVVDWTGLSMVGGRAFASSAHTLSEVATAGSDEVSLVPMFRHAQVGAPEDGCGGGDDAPCVERWAAFQEAASISGQANPATGPVTPPEEGCSTSHAGPSTWLLVGFAGWCVVVRRVRRAYWA